MLLIFLPDNPVVGDPDEGKDLHRGGRDAGFPGGKKNCSMYLQRNIKYPAIAREQHFRSRVCDLRRRWDGKIKDAKILRASAEVATKKRCVSCATCPNEIRSPEWSPCAGAVQPAGKLYA